MEDFTNIENIPSEQFEFANKDKHLSDRKFDDKPIGYLRDAWIRFRKNKASIAALVIIILIFLFAFLTPMFTYQHDSHFMDTYYAKMGPRNLTLAKIGIADGTTKYDFNEKGLIKSIAKGIAAEDKDGTGVTYEEGMSSKYQPIKNVGKVKTQEIPGKDAKLYFEDTQVEVYYDKGFLYFDVEQSEYRNIIEWEQENGVNVIYPLVAENEYCVDITDADCWYKSVNNQPVNISESGKVTKISYSEIVSGEKSLEDNYLRDAEGNVVYYKKTGGGTDETCLYHVRVLYYNYYLYKNGYEPEYLMGTDSQGYDLALRMAEGVRLSLLIAISVSIVNFIIGALYGAVEGYYGGIIDLIMERITDILDGVPFIVVATLFQISVARKMGSKGTIWCLLFAFVLTGWIGTAARIRTQFYRFKNQEYVMAARTLGAKDGRIIWKHIFPNSLGTLITSSALVIPGVIFSESMLSFLGIVNLGGSGTTSLGTLLSDASKIWMDYPHLMIFPATVISLLMISFNLFGNGLRDAFNPSLRGVEE